MAREPEPIVERLRALGTQLAAFRQAAELPQGHEKGQSRGDKQFWKAAGEAVHADGALLAGFYEIEIEVAKQEHDQQQRAARLAPTRAKAAAISAFR